MAETNQNPRPPANFYGKLPDSWLNSYEDKTRQLLAVELKIERMQKEKGSLMSMKSWQPPSSHSLDGMNILTDEIAKASVEKEELKKDVDNLLEIKSARASTYMNRRANPTPTTALSIEKSSKKIEEQAGDSTEKNTADARKPRNIVTRSAVQPEALRLGSASNSSQSDKSGSALGSDIAGLISSKLKISPLKLAVGKLLVHATSAVISSNTETASKNYNARSYGVGVEDYNAWGAVARQAGLQGANSLGEMSMNATKNVGAIQAGDADIGLVESFQSIGLDPSSLSGMDPAERLNEIMEKAFSMEDESKASYAIEQILGSDGVRAFNAVKATGKGWRENITDHKKYNLINQKDADRSADFDAAYDSLGTVADSISAKIYSRMGAPLTYAMQKTADAVAYGFKDGPTSVNEREDKKNVLLEFSKIGGGGEAGAREKAKGLGLTQWFEDLIAQNPNIGKEVNEISRQSLHNYGFDIEGHDKALSKYIDPPNSTFDLEKAIAEKQAAREGTMTSLNPAYPSIGSRLEAANDAEKSRIEDNRKQELHINVYPAAGQDINQVADTIISSANSTGVFNGNNAMYDSGGSW